MHWRSRIHRIEKHGPPPRRVRDGVADALAAMDATIGEVEMIPARALAEAYADCPEPGAAGERIATWNAAHPRRRRRGGN